MPNQAVQLTRLICLNNVSSKQFPRLTDNSTDMNIKVCINTQAHAFKRLVVVLHGLPPDIAGTTIPIAGQETRDVAQSSYLVTNAGPVVRGMTTGQHKAI
ncbi:hypothetical protein [Citrobacter cronae]|uniref:hypothetical protein n=1 Tax=Citrobacter cronae TaxID=1748967 RepID=UPI00209ED10C|nr:hypothetical protein [Citrobacter cronae]